MKKSDKNSQRVQHLPPFSAPAWGVWTSSTTRNSKILVNEAPNRNLGCEIMFSIGFVDQFQNSDFRQNRLFWTNSVHFNLHAHCGKLRKKILNTVSDP